jgi:hypothetical protein
MHGKCACMPYLTLCFTLALESSLTQVINNTCSLPPGTLRSSIRVGCVLLVQTYVGGIELFWPLFLNGIILPRCVF